MWQILLAKLTKNILRGVNFTNLKTQGGYIVKSKLQRVCLQLSQTPGGNYAIWPKLKYNFGCFHVNVSLLTIVVCY